MDAIVILSAFVAGLGISRLGLPPMLGYLAAGFLLGAFDLGDPEILNAISDLGITLLLFTIGLKLHIKDIAMPRIWAVTSVHMLLTVVVFSLLLMLLTLAGFSSLESLDWQTRGLIAFSLSFSSTVFVVKVLEEQGDMSSLHGNTAIGILVLQDIIAVVFMTVIGGEMPQWYAVATLMLIATRPLLLRLLQKSGHDELLTLLGFALALGGFALFEAVGLKGGLGALFIGAIIAGDKKSDELAKDLMQFKELFLVGFFLTVGLNGLPTSEQLLLALILAVVSAIYKPVLFVLLFSRSHLKPRTSFLGALALSNFSEFGLIVVALISSLGLLSNEWTVTLALALALSFVLAAFINKFKHQLYARWHGHLLKLQTDLDAAGQEPLDIGDAQFMVLGMGRTGTGAYDYLYENVSSAIIGVDERQYNADRQVEDHRKVICGDATSMDFWERIDLSKVKLILLTITNIGEIVLAADLIRQRGYQGNLGAATRYEDEAELLHRHGIKTFNLYAGAGAGFAEHIYRNIEELKPVRDL